MSRLGIFDCFCGLGGLSLGAEYAGHEVVGGLDVSPDAVVTYSKNFPGKIGIRADITKISAEVALKTAGIKRSEIDVVAGGPPCQSFSINNHKRGASDPRSQLINNYFDYVDYLNPKWLVLENVPGLKSISNGKLLQNFLCEIVNRGFHPACVEVNAKDFGVPQSRRRLVIIASKAKTKARKLGSQLVAEHADVVSVWDAISDLPRQPSAEAVYVTKSATPFQRLMRGRKRGHIGSHFGHVLGPANLERVKHIPQGGNWRDIPRQLLPKGMQRASLSDHTTRYGRLSPNRPSYTILTKCDPHWGCYFHPFEDRVITIREAARIQSIPDSVIFPLNIAAAYRLVGNAVPPLLAKAIFNKIT